MPNYLLDDLKQEIADHKVIAIVGTGATIAATGLPVSGIVSWRGLLHNGVERCRQIVSGLSDGWVERANAQIDSGDIGELLGAAENVTEKLKTVHGEFARWIDDTVGELKLVHRELPDAIAALGTPIVTTNYDTLLEDATGLQPVSWRQANSLLRELRVAPKKRRAVVHLHGVWNDADSIVLGIRSYEHIRSSAEIQAGMQAAMALKTLLFVGFGQGLADPNFGALIDWLRVVFPQGINRHYRLVMEQEVAAVSQEYGGALRALSYGSNYADLPAFLRQLVGQPPAITASAQPGHSAVASQAALTPPANVPAVPSGPPTQYFDMDHVQREFYGTPATRAEREVVIAFREIAQDMATNVFYATGSRETTAALRIAEHNSFYYQGKNAFLKVLTFTIPPGSRFYRPGARGNDAKVDYAPDSWVFLRGGEEITQLVPSALPGECHFDLPAFDSPAWLYSIAVFAGAQSFSSGKERIFVEVSDLCGLVKKMTLSVGGRVRFLRFDTIYAFSHGYPLRFSAFPQGQMRGIPVSADRALACLRPVIAKFKRDSDVRRSSPDQKSWNDVLKLWTEMSAAGQDAWVGLELSGVTADLVVKMTGEALGNKTQTATKSRGGRGR